MADEQSITRIPAENAADGGPDAHLFLFHMTVVDGTLAPFAPGNRPITDWMQTNRAHASLCPMNRRPLFDADMM